MKKLLFILITIGFTACATYTPPNKYSVENEKTISKDFDEVWADIIDWFGRNNIAIKTMEKASGIIIAEKLMMSEIAKKAADCGTDPNTRSRGGMAEVAPPIVKFNITAREKSENETHIRINVFFEPEKARKAFIYPDIHCNSTGYFEKIILSHIE